jgi:hypothetical protein
MKMETLNINDMENLKKELERIQSKTLGLFRNQYSKEWEIVIEADEHTFKTITISGLMGFSENNYPVNGDYYYTKFPDNKTLTEMLENPFEFNEFINKITE